MGVIKVLKVAEGRGLDTRNNVVRTVQIQYMVDDHGPFTVEGTPQEFGNGTLKTRMQEFARQVTAVQQ